MKKLYFLLTLVLSFFLSIDLSFSSAAEGATFLRNASVILRPILRRSPSCSATHALNINGEGGTSLGSRSLKVAEYIIPSIPRTLHLDLSHNGFPKEDFTRIGILISKNPHIKGLDLSHNGLKICRSSLYTKPLHNTLEKLLLNNNHLREESINKIFESWGNTSLKEVDLSGNPLTDFWFLKEGFKGKNTLSHINIAHTGLTPSCLKLFGEELSSHIPLIDLDLSGNILGNQGAFLLSTFLKNHPSLKTLTLTNTHITDLGARAVSVLLRNPQLERLDLRQNPISENGILSLLNTLNDLPRKPALGLSFPQNKDFLDL